MIVIVTLCFIVKPYAPQMHQKRRKKNTKLETIYVISIYIVHMYSVSQAEAQN